MLRLSCCSTEKFHSSTVGVFASACTPCGAKIVHGEGTPGPQEGGTGTFGVIGNSEGNEPVNAADPL